MNLAVFNIFRRKEQSLLPKKTFAAGKFDTMIALRSVKNEIVNPVRLRRLVPKMMKDSLWRNSPYEINYM